MALLDVSDVVLDPDFADYLILKRGVQEIGTNGRALNPREETPFMGVVTQYSGTDLERLEIGDQIKGAILVHSKEILTTGSSITPADIVEFRGRDYTVAHVDSYSHFGAGFSAARCDLIPLKG
jgi:hypothetical protein